MFDRTVHGGRADHAPVLGGTYLLHTDRQDLSDEEIWRLSSSRRPICLPRGGRRTLFGT